MADMEAYLSNLQPDLLNMTRLFQLPDRVWEEMELKARAEEGLFRARVRGLGLEREKCAEIPGDTGDERLTELHRRRCARRLCRQTLYELCREATGMHPPWGSLTGIRPTRLLYEGLESGLSLKAAAERVRRDFDVTAEKAELLREVVETQSSLLPPDMGQADVYIGIPFCVTRCSYCSFSSGEIGDGHLVEPYLDALEAEMREGAELLRESGLTLRSLYMGGGTPTSLTAKQLDRVLKCMRRCFPGRVETTVEAGRPDTLEREKFRVIRAWGADRISINPQTMNDETLRVIGRKHTAEDVRQAYAMARETGMDHINMDLIAGLPGEDTDMFAHTLREAEALRPESLTVHTLAIKRSSRMQQTGEGLPEGGMVSRMVDMARDCARFMGMRPYYLYRQKSMAGNLENVGYALPGHACQYNVDIMEEHTHILAFGAGGISKRVFPEEGHIERAPNVSNIEIYIEKWREMAGRKRDLFLPRENE